MQAVHFDKITSRIVTLCYGLDMNYVDPVSYARTFPDSEITSRLCLLKHLSRSSVNARNISRYLLHAFRVIYSLPSLIVSYLVFILE